MAESPLPKWVPFALIVVAVGGYILGSSVGGDGEDDDATSTSNSNSSLIAAFNEKDNALEACLAVVAAAREVIEGRTGYIENMYDDLFDVMREAYDLGQGTDEDGFLGLARLYYDRDQSESVTRSNLRMNNWFGWAPAVAVELCNSGELALGLPPGLELPLNRPTFASVDEVEAALDRGGIDCQNPYLDTTAELGDVYCSPVEGKDVWSLLVILYDSPTEARHAFDQPCEQEDPGYTVYRDGGNWLALVSETRGEFGLQEVQPPQELADRIAQALGGSVSPTC